LPPLGHVTREDVLDVTTIRGRYPSNGSMVPLRRATSRRLDLGRQRALVEQEAFEALDVLIALGDLLPLLFQL